jgi:hypothetical protein
MPSFRLLFTFYKSFAAASLAITLACGSILLAWGLSAFVAVFWFKVLTLLLMYFYIKAYKRNEFLYYQNLGISKHKIWISALVLDGLIFLGILIITLKIG